MRLRRWYVSTPVFVEVVCHGDDAGNGPTEPLCDVIEIEAATAKDAICLGVVEMLKGGRQDEYSRYTYCLDARSDGECPYSGVTAEEVPAANNAPGRKR